jgi:branched-chain amino acid transport system substrate-binding protein
LRKLKFIALISVVAASLSTAGLVSGSAGAQTRTAAANDKTVHIFGSYEKVGESPLAVPQFEDAAQLAIKDLKKKGITVEYDRIPGQSISVAPAQAAFLAGKAKNPDVFIGLTASPLFAITPDVVSSGIPTLALASPGTGIKSGAQGGDNIFLLRPLNDSTAAKITDYACQNAKLKKIGVLAVNLAFGTDSTAIAKKEADKFKGCKIVTTQTNGFADTDLTQQVLAFKDAGVDGILAFDYPNPFGVFVKQMQDNGVDVPILGGASLGIAVDGKTITNTQNLVVIDDCVPQVEKSTVAKNFVKEFQKAYGYVPNYAAAQVYDGFFMAANAVQKAGHNPAAITKALSGTQYEGVCSYKNDKNNVLGNSVTVYKYNPDGSRKLLKKYPLAYIPSDEVVAVTTTTAPPATTVPAGG